jgi:hypothetical protein
MKSRKSFLLRMNPALYDAVEAWAQQEMRSVNSQIEFLLNEAVKKHGRPIADGAETTEAMPPDASASENSSPASPSSKHEDSDSIPS